MADLLNYIDFLNESDDVHYRNKIQRMTKLRRFQYSPVNTINIELFYGNVTYKHPVLKITSDNYELSTKLPKISNGDYAYSQLSLTFAGKRTMEMELMENEMLSSEISGRDMYHTIYSELDLKKRLAKTVILSSHINDFQLLMKNVTFVPAARGNSNFYLRFPDGVINIDIKKGGTFERHIDADSLLSVGKSMNFQFNGSYMLNFDFDE